MEKNLYIASCEKDGGIYQYHLHENGSCDFINFTQLDRPMYMVIEDHRMYIVLMDPLENGESSVVAYDLDQDGRLKNPSDLMPTKGEEGCHIMVHRGEIYCANYASGSFIRLPETIVQHEGHGPHPIRQEKAHVHFVGLTPDAQYLCVADLGLDTIFLYERESLRLHSRIQVPSGHGVRHLIFSEDGRYLFSANELASTVSAFSYHDGSLQLLDTQSTLPDTFTGENTTAAIRRKEDTLYVSNRGYDTVAKMEFRNHKLTLADQISCHGKTPRDFILADHYLISANYDSDLVAILDENKDFGVIETLAVKKPICACVL